MNISFLARNCHEAWKRIETRTAKFNNTGLESYASCWRKLFSNMYDGNSEVCFLGTAFRKIPRTR